jgi:hypothetical protein
MNALHDENARPTITAVSSNDGDTVIPCVAIPASHRIRVNDDTTGSDNGNNQGNAMIDENSVATMTALSSDNDGTIVELYIDPLTKALLINSN